MRTGVHLDYLVTISIDCMGGGDLVSYFVNTYIIYQHLMNYYVGCLQSHLFLPSLHTAGVVTLLQSHTICQEGDVLSPEQATLLVSESY